MKRLFIIAFVVIIIVIGVFFHFFDMTHLPQGELIKESLSPSGKYTLNLYLCKGNATAANSVRGEIIVNGKNTARNIYWQYKEDNATIHWITDETVSINGITLNVNTDSYDWRR